MAEKQNLPPFPIPHPSSVSQKFPNPCHFLPFPAISSFFAPLSLSRALPKDVLYEVAFKNVSKDAF